MGPGQVGTGTGAWAVIPARGGSRGIPGKNLARVGGQPLVARTVRTALGATLVDRVVVSTDDEEIALAARDAGSEVVMRPEEIAGDDATSESALLHALDTLAGQPEVTVMLQCTSPFTDPSDIDAAIRLVSEGGADCAFTVTPTHAFLWRDDEDGPRPVNHEMSSRQMRQQRPAEYEETGAVYVMRTAGLRDTRHRFFGTVAMQVVPRLRAMQIDEPADLDAARALSPLLDAAQARARLPVPVDALVLDFDGVLTDNRVLTLVDGSEGITTDRGDGLGLERLRTTGIPVMVLSKEKNPVVATRCAKLGLEHHHGIDDKWPALRRWLDERGLRPGHTVYVGNDVNDLTCLEQVGAGVAVADAHPSVRYCAGIVLTRPGGHGAVREICDLILDAHGTS